MKLIVAEKPSVAGEIAKIVGATQGKQGYKTGSGYIVTWCYGHLIELAQPERYDEKYKKWNVADLPIIPTFYKTDVINSKSSIAQYNVVKQLMNSNEVEEIIEATDAGREGELIFRLVYEQAKCKKPVKRLWISSLEEESIRKGLKEMKPGSAYDNLFRAARSRQRADWVYGINLTRLYSGLYPQAGTLNCGRVQTPTVQFIVQRKQDIDNFIPKTYYTLHADLGEFEALKNVENKDEAERIVRTCENQTAFVTAVKKETKKKSPPKLYDLTSLQRDANRMLGFSAQQTLDTLQSLYEAKLATYPRTDSNYLTSTMEGSTRELIGLLVENNVVPGGYNLSNVNISRVIDDGKVSDHHAILPTKELTPEAFNNLPTGEKNIATLIIYRLLAAVYTPYIYSTTTADVNINDEAFVARGREIIDLGHGTVQLRMKEVLGEKSDSKKSEKKDTSLPSLTEGDTFRCTTVKAEEKQTDPPKPFTEDTLLAAMETAGKTIEDERLKEAMKDCGLGTPATRAGIIENIIKTGYVERKGKSLFPTPKAVQFMAVVADEVKQPKLTAEWEEKLALIQKGEYDEKDFMYRINLFVETLTKELKETVTRDTSEAQFKKPEKEILGKCPKCGSGVIEITSKGNTYYTCSRGRECSFFLFGTIAGKKLGSNTVKQLLREGKTGVIKGFKSKAGKTFSAALVLTEDCKINFDFQSN